MGLIYFNSGFERKMDSGCDVKTRRRSCSCSSDDNYLVDEVSADQCKGEAEETQGSCKE